MPFSGVVQDVAAAGPWAVVVLVLLGLVIVFTGAAVLLRIALSGTSEAARPGIISALGELVRALFWRRK
ncbi:hypothetical protein [Streptomyces sp. NPDC004528]|uniref:hypothetical protein n=1 Tax=Streptomyces sp. NPDC004528 TaxID=3154550 RepID=UPI0033A182AC